MIDNYLDERNVRYSDADFTLNLGILNMFDYAQDLATEFFAELGMDNETIKAKYNFAWVITKIKLKILKVPVWKTKLKGESHLTSVGRVKMVTENIFKDEKDEICFILDQEFCLINLETRKIVKIEEVNFPKEIKIYPQINNDFVKLTNITKDDNSIHYIRQVQLSDLDYTIHTNNTSYIRFIFDVLGKDFIYENKITELDVIYIRETKLNETLNIYKNINKDEIDLVIDNGTEEVFKAKIIYEIN